MLINLLLHRIYHWLDPAGAILFELFIQSLIEIQKSSITSRYNNILKKIMPNAFICKFQRFQYSSRNSFLLQANILWIKKNLRNLKSLLIKRYMLCIDTLLKYEFTLVDNVNCISLFFKFLIRQNKMF